MAEPGWRAIPLSKSSPQHWNYISTSTLFVGNQISWICLKILPNQWLFLILPMKVALWRTMPHFQTQTMIFVKSCSMKSSISISSIRNQQRIRHFQQFQHRIPAFSTSWIATPARCLPFLEPRSPGHDASPGKFHGTLNRKTVSG